MSTDLHTQLAEYGRYQRSERRPVELTDIQAAADANGAPGAPSHGHRIQSEPNEGELIMVDMQTRETATAQTDRRRWPGLAILAAAAVIIVIVAVVLFDDTEESTEIDAVDGSELTEQATPEPPVPEPPVFGPESSLAVVNDYFTAHEVGDIDSVFAMFTADATFSDSFSASMDRTGWEPRFAWDLAQGEMLVSPDCSVVDEVPGSTVTISCSYGTFDAVGVAVDAVGIPTVAEMTITPDGISNLHESYGRPDFTATGAPFARWMEQNRPDDAEATGCCEGVTVEESVARGGLRAEYATEWAAYLEANDCTYTDSNC